MSGKRHAGFTLVELLVVIAIIVILMSILLPALEHARTTVGVGMCAANLRYLGQGLHSYVNEFNGHIPMTFSSGNLETYEMIDGYYDQLSGLGKLYEADYVTDAETYYCPDADVWWGTPAKRREHIAKFDQHMSNPVGYYPWQRSDYVLGWWGSPKLEKIKRNRVAWSADAHDWAVWRPHGYHPMAHQRWKYMNVGTLDGSSRCIIDYMDRLPRSGSYGYYWPHNDRPGWGWWHYFGTGKGL